MIAKPEKRLYLACSKGNKIKFPLPGIGGKITFATTPFVVVAVIHAGIGVKAYPGIILLFAWKHRH